MINKNIEQYKNSFLKFYQDFLSTSYKITEIQKIFLKNLETNNKKHR